MANDAFYEAYVEVIPTAKGFERSLNKQLAGPSAGAGTAAGGAAGVGFVGAFGKAIPILGGVLAAAGIGDMISTAIEDAGTYQQAQGAVESVFGQLGADAIKAFAEGGAQSVGQSMNDILQSSSLLGIFGKAAGLADGELVDFSENLITLGADLSAFANTSPEEAVEALSAGLRGESEPLRKYGVLLDDATLKARAMEMGIYDGNGPLTQQQRILAAYSEILAQTTDQQGTFAEEADTLAGQQARTAAAWENISTKIGTAFLPVAEDLSAWFLEEGIPALEEFADWLNKPETQEGIDNFTTGLQEIGNFLRDYVVNPLSSTFGVVDFFVSMLNGITLEEFKTKLLEAPGWLGAVATGAFNAGMGIANFVNGVILNVRNFSRDVQINLASVVSWFQQLPVRIAEVMSGIGSWLYNSGKSLIQGFINGISAMVDSVGAAVGGVMDFVAGFFPNSPAKHGPLSGAGWTRLGQSGAAIAQQFAAGIESDYARLRSAASGMVGAAVPAMGPTYVQNPFTGAYLLAQVADVAGGVVARADRDNATAIRSGMRKG